jgi:hypothetical protein
MLEVGNSMQIATNRAVQLNELLGIRHSVQIVADKSKSSTMDLNGGSVLKVILNCWCPTL